MKVGIAMPSVFRVRMVAMAWGRYPKTMQMVAKYPMMFVTSESI
jgi:hypothetical protein